MQIYRPIFSHSKIMKRRCSSRWAMSSIPWCRAVFPLQNVNLSLRRMRSPGIGERPWKNRAHRHRVSIQTHVKKWSFAHSIGNDVSIAGSQVISNSNAYKLRLTSVIRNNYWVMLVSISPFDEHSCGIEPTKQKLRTKSAYVTRGGQLYMKTTRPTAEQKGIFVVGSLK